MTLLKSQNPTKDKSLTIKDGWYFGIGFGLAMTIALPIILGVIGCAVVLIMSALGNTWP